ncbi:hypothetical protein CONPUDRAFT_166765 [Coniophora puteana RWD-64-598 SS2]|uniref:FAD-binding domain-containing protein n=1 Tax=Coniophora puteana (strain RWD-64-598) TaxID=741705 RepID=A0A5M3MI17_CONPW|nr:uncharacterized protein CONPUDRAFT_166765 [Coniophora puteana RWD-64-598 SS2]EIW78888.1 hypothetical protein CONPUDRAFT_166765 [Coniophora puteana RWD-64-598 SS2]
MGDLAFIPDGLKVISATRPFGARTLHIHPRLSPFRDISFGPNAGQIIQRWSLHDKIRERCRHVDKLVLHDYLGEIVREQPLPLPLWSAWGYDGHHAEMQRVIYEYAVSLGIDVRFGHTVQEYYEDEAGRKAGVRVESKGEVTSMEADLVVAADGVKSKARKYILGYDDKPRSSGYAVYRAWFNGQEQGVDTDPLTDYLTKGEDAFFGWIGRDVQFLASSARKEISWVITLLRIRILSVSLFFPSPISFSPPLSLHLSIAISGTTRVLESYRC